MNVSATFLLAAYAIVLAAAAPPPKTAPMSKYQRAHLEALQISAPADEYFGRLKMSYLGINNTLHDAAISSGDHTTDPAIVSKVGFAEDALTDWEHKYPHDPQLARTYFLAIQSEKRIWLRPNQERAWAYMNRIVKVFPSTYFGRLVKKDLAIGFTEHYYGDPVMCPTAEPTATPTPLPTPSPTPAPAARGRRAPAPTPVPTTLPTPTPTATPEPTPVPTPRVRSVAAGLKVQVEVAPCVPPATPSPSPSPVSEPSPAPTASASPSAATPAAGASPSAAASPAAAPSTPAPSPSASPR